MAEPLTRETRYEGRFTIDGTELPVGETIGWASLLEVTRCLSCGSIVVIGSEDQHEYMHPLASCNTVHPGCDINCHGSHPWESQFVTWTTLGSPP